MKTRIIVAVLFSAFLLGTSFLAYAQEMSRQDYFQKSKNKKTAAFILLGAGALMVGTGILLYNEITSDAGIVTGAMLFGLGGSAT